MADHHTKWFLTVLNALSDEAREHIISMCLHVLDTHQYRVKAHYDLTKAGDARVRADLEEEMGDLPVGQVLMIKEPTIENLESAIQGIVEQGVVEPFLLTSLYHLVTSNLKWYADPVQHARCEENMRGMIAELQAELAECEDINRAIVLQGCVHNLERSLSEGDDALRRHVAWLDEWEHLTGDRGAAGTFYGRWTDFPS